MSRATPMPPDERRAAIIAAARPLLVEYGLDFTTRQVAEAAGVAEGTIFRVFDSIAEVQREVIASLLDTEPMRAELAGIDPASPLDDRVRRIIELLQAYARESHLLFAVLHKLPENPDRENCRRHTYRESVAALLAQIEDLLRPDADAFLLPLNQTASLLRTLAVSSEHPMLGVNHPKHPTILTALFLDGARKDNA